MQVHNTEMKTAIELYIEHASMIELLWFDKCSSNITQERSLMLNLGIFSLAAVLIQTYLWVLYFITLRD